MTATIAIPDRQISRAPVKDGHTRFYVGTFGWTETRPRLTPEDAEMAIFPEYRRPNFGSVLALDVPNDRVFVMDGQKTFHCEFHGHGSYRNYVVGSRPAGGVEEEEWHG